MITGKESKDSLRERSRAVHNRQNLLPGGAAVHNRQQQQHSIGGVKKGKFKDR
jgi:hypothetical protein